MTDLFVPSAEFVNAVINAPGVRATVQPGQHRLDASELLAQPRHAAVACRGGVAVFEHVEGGLYEGHVFCLPGHRGAAALQFGRAALGWLFAKGAERIVATASMDLPAARFYCRRLGLLSVARDLFQEYFAVEAQQWAA
jgi:hypothetical protein